MKSVGRECFRLGHLIAVLLRIDGCGRITWSLGRFPVLHHLNLYDWYDASNVWYVALFPLCLTDWESRFAVNNKTAHCSTNSVIQNLFHLPYFTPPQRWNEAFFTLSPYPKAFTWTKKIMELIWASWCAQRTPKDPAYRYAWSANAVLVGGDRTAGPVLDTKAKQKQLVKLLKFFERF